MRKCTAAAFSALPCERPPHPDAFSPSLLSAGLFPLVFVWRAPAFVVLSFVLPIGTRASSLVWGAVRGR